MNENPLKVLEVTASDGKLEIFRQFLVTDKENKPEYLYILKETGNVIDIESTFFRRFWKNVLKKYPEIYGWDLQFVHDDLKIEIIKNIRAKIGIRNNWISDTWREKLGNDNDIIDTIDYFDYEFFLEQMIKFKNRIEIESWNYITLNHSKIGSLKDFNKHLLDKQYSPLNIPGIYSYFLENECIYIGKAKNIQKRLESHFLSANNIGNHSRGEKQRKLFGKYLTEELTVFYTKMDDTFSSQIGEELRNTLERLLHLKYKPEFLEMNIEK